MIAPLASVELLGLFLKRPFVDDSPEEKQAELVLQVVSAWARTVAGKAWTDVPPPDDVVGVVLAAARRELSNPDRLISENMGPISITRAVPPPGFFTSAEMAILRRKASGALHTISTRREEESWGVGYLHMKEDLSDELFPYLNSSEPGWDETIHL